jgi:hypothetical protein
LALAFQVANGDARGDRDSRDRPFELAGEGGAECTGLIGIGANMEVGRRNGRQDRKGDRGDGCYERVAARNAHLRVVQSLPASGSLIERWFRDGGIAREKRMSVRTYLAVELMGSASVRRYNMPAGSFSSTANLPPMITGSGL